MYSLLCYNNHEIKNRGDSMNNSEKYYRRAFNALQKLIKAYKNGYTPKTMNDFRTSLILSGVQSQTLMKEEQLSIINEKLK